MISYEPFFDLMKKKGITRYRIEKLGFNHLVYSRIKAGKSISSKTLNELCIILDCQPKDILKFTLTDDDITLKKELREKRGKSKE